MIRGAKLVMIITVLMMIAMVIDIQDSSNVAEARYHYHKKQKNKATPQPEPEPEPEPEPDPEPEPVASPPPDVPSDPDDPSPPENPSPVVPSDPYPVNEDCTFDVTAYGAVGDGSADDTAAFREAWKAACAVEGGVLLAPANYCFKITSTIFSGPCKPGLVFQVSSRLLLYN